MTTQTTPLGEQGSGVVDTEQGGAQNTPAAVPQETIDYAKSLGWTPKDEWRGDPAKWVDAPEYSERAKQINTVVTKSNSRLREELAQTKEELRLVRSETQQAIDFARKQEKERYEGRLAELRQQKAAAISDNDGARVLEIEDEIERLPKPEAPPKKTPDAGTATSSAIPDAVREAGDAFIARNPWYGDGPESDPAKQDLCLTVAAQLRRENPTIIQTPAYFAEIEKRLEQRYPSIFAKKQPPALTEGGGAPGGARATGAAKGYAELPAEAKKTADRFAANYGIDKEAYAKEFWNEQAKAGA